MNRNKKMLAMIAKKEARKAELIEKAKTSNDVAELRGINADIETINSDIADIRATITVETDEDDDDDVCPECGAEIDEDDKFCPSCGAALTKSRGKKPKGEKRSKQPDLTARSKPQGQINVMGTYGIPGAQGSDDPNKRDFSIMSREELLKAPEYRSAYLKSLQQKSINEVEQRALTTAAGSGGAAVPTMTYDMIIERLRQTSVLFPLISVSNFPSNVTLPVANPATAAIWSAEANPGNTGDDGVTGVTLMGYTLAKYAQISIAAMAMTVDAFEAYIVKQIGEQLAIAVENAILNGLGPNPGGSLVPQPTGILPGVTWDTTNSITTGANITYDNMVATKALLRSMYRPGAVWVMNTNMEAELSLLRTSTGEPILVTDVANGLVPKILGFEYRIDDYIPNDTILLGRMDFYYMNFAQGATIEMSKEAGFTSASVYYRGVLVADGKPALSEAFVKLVTVG